MYSRNISIENSQIRKLSVNWETILLADNLIPVSITFDWEFVFKKTIMVLGAKH